jgi:hypothetical protein
MRTCSTHGRDEQYIQNFGCKAEGKRSIVTPRCKWKNNIKMYLNVLLCVDVDCTQLAERRAQ